MASAAPSSSSSSTSATAPTSAAAEPPQPPPAAGSGSSTTTAEGAAGTEAQSGAATSSTTTAAAAAAATTTAGGAGGNAGASAASAAAAPASHSSSSASSSKAASSSSSHGGRRRGRKHAGRGRGGAGGSGSGAGASTTAPVVDKKTQERKAAAEKLKRQGNEFFTKKNFVKAKELYTNALKHDPTNHLILGNRSAAHHALGEFSAALTDANAAVAACPDWAKGYHRQAAALIGLGRPRDAVMAYSVAHRIEPHTDWIAKQLNATMRKADHLDRTADVASADHWKRVFKAIRGPRMRLATLAHFWNEASQTDRFSVFVAFLNIVANAATAAELKSKYTPDAMRALPLHNYEDIVIPEPWMKYYKALSSPNKVACFADMWAIATVDEQNLIMKDMRYFFEA